MINNRHKKENNIQLLFNYMSYTKISYWIINYLLKRIFSGWINFHGFAIDGHVYKFHFKKSQKPIEDNHYDYFINDIWDF
jgi:hypothetical protein